MVFLAHVSVRHFKEMIQMLAEGSLDSEDPCGYVIEIIGVVEKFNRICEQLYLVLKEPIGDSTLSRVYKEQGEKLRLVADQIREIGKMINDDFPCNSTTTTYVDDTEDVVTSIVHITIPKEMRRKVANFRKGNVVKMTCYLTFRRGEESLCLIAQSIETVTKVKLIIK